MKKEDRYLHFKGGNYVYMGMALPMTIATHIGVVPWREVTSAEDGVTKIPIYSENGVWFAPLEEPVVLYYNVELPHKWWARKVDDFFGYKEHEDGRLEKRFVRLKEGE